MTADVLVLGVGGMGSAAAYHLAARGAKVVGIDAHPPGHTFGSSHGDVRLIRQAYFEEAAYVPLLKRTYELWDALAEEAKYPLFHRTGLLLLSPKAHAASVDSARGAAEKHRVPIEIIEGAALARRFPQFRLGDDFVGLLEPGAGFLEVERCVIEHARLASQRGATLVIGETARSWSRDGDGVEVTTEKATYRAAKLVVAAGPWSAAVLQSLRLPLTVRRVVQLWFPNVAGFEERDGFPCFAFDTPEGFYYGFPNRERGFKVAEHAKDGDVVADPATVERKLRAGDTDRVHAALARWLPQVRREPIDSAVCLYTLTPDEHFIVDRKDNVVFAAGFSGHGFKFAAVMGEILADLALDGTTRHPIDFLSLRRYS